MCDFGNLSEHLVDLLARSTPDINDLIRTLALAVKLDIPSVIRTQRLEQILHSDQAEQLLICSSDLEFKQIK